MKYYFVSTSLPELRLGFPPEMYFPEFVNLLKLNLTPEDYAKSVVMRRYYDMYNIRAFWKGEDFNQHGNYNENDLEEALLTRSGLPEYVYDYLDKYDKHDDRVNHFPELIAAYFREEIKKSSGFLHEYLIFEREWRLVLAGFRAKQLGRDISLELQYEDPDNEVVAQIYAQKDSKTFEPPSNYEDLKGIFEAHYQSPLELYQALCEYRFNKLEEFYGLDQFSIDRILVYMAQLIIVEQWIELDKEKGLGVVEGILKSNELQ